MSEQANFDRPDFWTHCECGEPWAFNVCSQFSVLFICAKCNAHHLDLLKKSAHFPGEIDAIKSAITRAYNFAGIDRLADWLDTPDAGLDENGYINAPGATNDQ